jgi:hypothetical protein
VAVALVHGYLAAGLLEQAASGEPRRATADDGNVFMGYQLIGHGLWLKVGGFMTTNFRDLIKAKWRNLAN